MLLQGEIDLVLLQWAAFRSVSAWGSLSNENCCEQGDKQR